MRGENHENGEWTCSPRHQGRVSCLPIVASPSLVSRIWSHPTKNPGCVASSISRACLVSNSSLKPLSGNIFVTNSRNRFASWRSMKSVGGLFVNPKAARARIVRYETGNVSKNTTNGLFQMRGSSRTLRSTRINSSLEVPQGGILLNLKQLSLSG